MAGPTDSLQGLERELTRLFRRSRAASAQVARQVHPDLEPAGYVVLLWLLEQQQAGHPAVRASDLADHLQLHKSNASRAVTELERLGLLQRVVDPEDARARLLGLSAAGLAAVQRVQAGRREHFATRLDGWADGDLVALADLLGRLNDDLAAP